MRIELSHDDFFNRLYSYPGPADRLLTGSYSKVPCRDIPELPLEFTDRGTTGTDNDCIFHKHLPLSFHPYPVMFTPREHDFCMQAQLMMSILSAPV
jgi:hypothetical protein